MDTQNIKILNHLKHGSITSWEAIQKYHITRLSARVYELKQMGYDIKSVREEDDDGSHYARYFLLGGGTTNPSTSSQATPPFSEDDLTTMSKEEFCKTFRIPEEEWDSLQKDFQEM